MVLYVCVCTGLEGQREAHVSYITRSNQVGWGQNVGLKRFLPYFVILLPPGSSVLYKHMSRLSSVFFLAI